MDTIVRLSVLFCTFFAVKITLASENGYILFETANITCKDPSSAKSPCSSVLDYKIPESSNDSFIPDLSSLSNLIPTTTQILNASAGEQCSKAGAKYLCQAAYPFRCDDEYIEVDGKEILASCNESRKNCSRLGKEARDAMFNCSIIASNLIYQQKIPRKINCEAFPTLNDDPYTCDANYKVGLVIEVFYACNLLSYYKIAKKRYKRKAQVSHSCVSNVYSKLSTALEAIDPNTYLRISTCTFIYQH